MVDFALLLCCFNKYKLNCLEMVCLIKSFISFVLSLSGLITIKWPNFSNFFQVLYSVGFVFIFFGFILILVFVYFSKKGKILSEEYRNIFKAFSLMQTFLTFSTSVMFFILVIQLTINYKKTIFIFIKKQKNSNFQKNLVVENPNILKSLIILYSTAIVTAVLSFINILIWISIFYRINYRLYCSYTKQIRKMVIQENNKLIKEISEKSTKNSSNSNNNENKEKEQDIISVVIEKSRHPAGSNSVFIGYDIDKQSDKIYTDEIIKNNGINNDDNFSINNVENNFDDSAKNEAIFHNNELKQ